jgi:6-phosphogluconolactonase (cycloisomerase 2 family)
MTFQAPEAVSGTRRQPKRKDGPPGLPSLHHIQYSPNGRYLLAVDPSQDCIFTYSVDKRGLPKAKVPTSIFQCHSDYSIYGFVQRLITKHVLKSNQRVRKAVVHPNGKIVYVLYESINRLQVYSINEGGVIGSSGNGNSKDPCLQDISTLDPSFTSSNYRPVGLALQCAAELYVTRNGETLLLSNRGDKLMATGSRVENSVRVLDIQQEGRVLVPKGVLPGVSGPVRHFLSLENDKKIVVASYKDKQCLQTYQRQEEREDGGEGGTTSGFKLLGEANVKANVFCIAH